MRNFVIGVLIDIEGVPLCETPLDRVVGCTWSGICVDVGVCVKLLFSSYLLRESCIVWLIIGSSIIRDIQANRVDGCRVIGGVLSV